MRAIRGPLPSGARIPQTPWTVLPAPSRLGNSRQVHGTEAQFRQASASADEWGLAEGGLRFEMGPAWSRPVHTHVTPGGCMIGVSKLTLSTTSGCRRTKSGDHIIRGARGVCLRRLKPAACIRIQSVPLPGWLASISLNSWPASRRRYYQSGIEMPRSERTGDPDGQTETEEPPVSGRRGCNFPSTRKVMPDFRRSDPTTPPNFMGDWLTNQRL